jgi:hypothetical protein
MGNSIKLNLKNTIFDYVFWIYVAQGRVK